MPRAVSAFSLFLAVLFALSACGSDQAATEAGPTQGSSGTPTIEITINADGVDPQGAVMKVRSGEPVKLRITAEKPGELHVHSSPEQEVEYPAGTSEKTLTLDQPGVVDVEDHELDALIVQLQVR